MGQVSAEEWSDWLSQRSADALREQLAGSASLAREELLARGLKSSDPDVRAAAERAQTLLELVDRLRQK